METILAYAVDSGSKLMHLGGVLEASRRNLETSSRRLKHTLGRLNASRRCRPQNLSVSVTGLGVSVGVSPPASPRLLFFFQSHQKTQTQISHQEAYEGFDGSGRNSAVRNKANEVLKEFPHAESASFEGSTHAIFFEKYNDTCAWTPNKVSCLFGLQIHGISSSGPRPLGDQHTCQQVRCLARSTC